jgi:hypothetical protein
VEDPCSPSTAASSDSVHSLFDPTIRARQEMLKSSQSGV